MFNNSRKKIRIRKVFSKRVPVNFDLLAISAKMRAQLQKKFAPFKMPEQENNTGKKFSTDWLLRGVLTKVGDAFDRLTGRGYRPSSSLATSELIEKLKKLLDHELRDGKFVPHNISLKMQWDKFSTDSDDSLQKLENELKIAVIDHINDRRYHTYAPISLRIKPDYFTEGVKLLVSFDKFDKEDHEVAVNVTVPQIRVGEYVPEIPQVAAPDPPPDRFIARYSAAGKARERELEFGAGKRLSVGRGSENDLVIDDPSVSKIHASLIVNSDRRLAVADTGSTNGTFVSGSRIAYGKAIAMGEDNVIKFGTIDVRFEHLTLVVEIPEESISEAPTEAFRTESEAESPTPRRIEVLKKIEPQSDTVATPEPTLDRIVLDFETQDEEK
jgi:hypothetical protein